jgi:hypothetical protein
MYAPSTQHSTRASLPQRPRNALAAAVVLLALAAGLTIPAAASAAGSAPDTTSPSAVSPLEPAKVQEVLAGVPLTDLSTTQLSEVLAKLPGLSALPAGLSQGDLATELAKAIKTLAGEGDTLGQLKSDPAELVSKLNLDGLLSSGGLLSLLGEPQNLSSLLSLLTTGLGSAEPGQLVGGLLGSAAKPEQPIDPAQLIRQVLTSASPEKLEALLGTTLTGKPFVQGTVGTVAGEVGTTSEALAKDLDATTSQLPATAMALTAPLTDGKTLVGVLGAVEGLDMGLLSPKEKAAEGSGGGSGGSGGSGSGSGGSSGGSGGSGAGGSGSAGDAGGWGGAGGLAASAGATGGSGGGSGEPAGTTIVVNNLPAQGSTLVSPGAKTSAKIEIVSRKVKGDAITLVVQVPAAGRLTVSGSGVKAASGQSDKAERVTLRTVLTKAGVASLRKHGHRLKVELKASFEEVAGASASAKTTVAVG